MVDRPEIKGPGFEPPRPPEDLGRGVEQGQRSVKPPEAPREMFVPPEAPSLPSSSVTVPRPPVSREMVSAENRAASMPDLGAVARVLSSGLHSASAPDLGGVSSKLDALSTTLGHMQEQLREAQAKKKGPLVTNALKEQITRIQGQVQDAAREAANAVLESSAASIARPKGGTAARSARVIDLGGEPSLSDRAADAARSARAAQDLKAKGMLGSDKALASARSSAMEASGSLVATGSREEIESQAQRADEANSTSKCIT